MRLLVDENVPERYVQALRGDGHTVISTRSVDGLGPGNPDEAIVDFALAESLPVLTTDAQDVTKLGGGLAILIAPQDMSGAAVRTAIRQVESLELLEPVSGPIWLSSLYPADEGALERV